MTPLKNEYRKKSYLTAIDLVPATTEFKILFISSAASAFLSVLFEISTSLV